MSQGWICRNCGEANSEGFTVCMRCGEVPDFPGGLTGRVFTKSKTMDTALAATATFLVAEGIVVVGAFQISSQTKSPWILGSIGLALALGLTAIYLLRPSYRALSLGVTIGLCIALLNPLSLCLGFYGLMSLTG